MVKIFILTILTLSVLYSCQETPESDGFQEEFAEYVPDNNEVAFEQLIAEIELNDSLRIGQSLFYSKEGGSSVDVRIRVNDSGEMVKMREEYTVENSQSINKNTFYFSGKGMFASIELFEEGEGETAVYVERTTYYDKDEKPIITKKRQAEYEEELDFETFATVGKRSASYDRALAVLNQEGEYGTTFQGFVKEEPYLYIIVGENEENGYYSSLVVQYMTPLIKTLQENEKSMVGTPLQIVHETLDGEQGYEYQILMNVKRK
ncbi:MAG: hypothetical protein COA33_010925 [Fluviicola sp.]|nr:hypothetical protein [Fluviicola sp.]